MIQAIRGFIDTFLNKDCPRYQRRNLHLPPGSSPEGALLFELGVVDRRQLRRGSSLHQIFEGPGHSQQISCDSEHGLGTSADSPIGPGPPAGVRHPCRPALIVYLIDLTSINPELRMEQTSGGEVTVMPSASKESSHRNGELIGRFQ